MKINQLKELLSAWENSRDILISRIDNQTTEDETPSIQDLPNDIAEDVLPEPPRQQPNVLISRIDNQPTAEEFVAGAEETPSMQDLPNNLAEDVLPEPPRQQQSTTVAVNDTAEPGNDAEVSDPSITARFTELPTEFSDQNEDICVEENANTKNQAPRKRLSLKRRRLSEPEQITTTNVMPISPNDFAELVLLEVARPHQSTSVTVNDPAEQGNDQNEGDITVEENENTQKQAPRKRLSLKLRHSSCLTANRQEEISALASVTTASAETEPLVFTAEPLLEINDTNETTITDAVHMLLQLAAGTSGTDMDGTSETDLMLDEVVQPEITITTSSNRADPQPQSDATNGGEQHQIDISDISLPPKIHKRGRPKGSELTVIGLPRKRLRMQKSKLVPFERMTDSQKQSFTLGWFVEKRVIDKCMSENHIIQEEEVEVTPNNISLACKEIEIDLIKKFFSEDAWKVVIQAVDIRKNQEWTCNVCQEELETRSCGCDRCLLWYHFHCASISSKPRTKFW